MSKRRLPAEWETGAAVMLAWPTADTDWCYCLDEVQQCYRALIDALRRHVRVLLLTNDGTGYTPEGVTLLPTPYNDTWTRDYGPVTVHEEGEPRMLNFAFNGWGLKFAADRDNLVTGTLFPDAECHLDTVLEGGALETDGRGTLLTTSRCQLSPNRNGYTRARAEYMLKQTLGVDRVLWLEHGALSGDDTDSHIDTLARFAPDGSILYVSCDDPTHPDYAELHAMQQELRAFGRELRPLPMAPRLYDDEGVLLPATYANFLVLPGVLLMPTYGDDERDTPARRVLQEAFPGYTIEEVDCRALVLQHGSLHCATMQLPFLP